MNGYTDCSQAQRDWAKKVAATYGPQNTTIGNDLAKVAEANGYHRHTVGTPGLVALCVGTTRIRAGIIVKGTKTRAYVLYYVKSTDRFYITTIDLAHLYVMIPGKDESWDQYHGRAQVANVLDTLAAQSPTCEKCGKVATQGGLCEDCWAAVPSTDPASEARVAKAKEITDRLSAEKAAKEEAPAVDLTPMDPADFRTGNLAEDVEAWLMSKGYGKK